MRTFLLPRTLMQRAVSHPGVLNRDTLSKPFPHDTWQLSHSELCHVCTRFADQKSNISNSGQKIVGYDFMLYVLSPTTSRQRCQICNALWDSSSCVSAIHITFKSKEAWKSYVDGAISLVPSWHHFNLISSLHKSVNGNMKLGYILPSQHALQACHMTLIEIWREWTSRIHLSR